MVIFEYQFCNVKHECSTDGGCSTPIREYNLPEHQRVAWYDFFSYLKADGVIADFEIR
jgi:hypothetical protein